MSVVNDPAYEWALARAEYLLSPIAVGDVVRLKSQLKPLLTVWRLRTVTDTGHAVVEVEWFDTEHQLHRDAFDIHNLRKTHPPMETVTP